MKKGSLDKTIQMLLAKFEAESCPEELFESLNLMMPEDQLLAELNKQYMDAKAFHLKLLEENGVDDPMAEVAADLLESARSAVQTRMLEVFRKRRLEVQMAVKEKARMQKLQNDARLLREKMAEKRRRESDDLFFYFVMFVWLLNRTYRAACARLSVVDTFAGVSGAAEYKKYA